MPPDNTSRLATFPLPFTMTCSHIASTGHFTEQLPFFAALNAKIWQSFERNQLTAMEGEDMVAQGSLLDMIVEHPIPTVAIMPMVTIT